MLLRYISLLVPPRGLEKISIELKPTVNFISENFILESWVFEVFSEVVIKTLLLSGVRQLRPFRFRKLSKTKGRVWIWRWQKFIVFLRTFQNMYQKIFQPLFFKSYIGSKIDLSA